ncbi:MAG: YjjG family noncanonical pyrimidine nucleotidase [Halanaerobium sp.]|nr:YjjG family noncanonical pyrimidine nucleotidase [Halanaerobium sp.]
MGKYQLLLLDADGTLFDFDRAEEYALEKTFLDFTIKPRPEYHYQFYREINEAIWDEFEKGLISAEDLKAERFNRLFTTLELALDPKEFSTKYLDNLGEAAFLLPGAPELVRLLAEDYHLVLLTNGLARVQHKRLSLSPIEKYFKQIIISEEVGAAKPNPLIFSRALEAAGHQNKATTLMVGDSLSSDIKGGCTFGIDTCWYNPDRKTNDTSIQPTFEISQLSQLKEILFSHNS